MILRRIRPMMFRALRALVSFENATCDSILFTSRNRRGAPSLPQAIPDPTPVPFYLVLVSSLRREVFFTGNLHTSDGLPYAAGGLKSVDASL